ncbi:hypothetical protein GGI43DRAFT_348171 [Trichoderma evansii]
MSFPMPSIYIIYQRTPRLIVPVLFSSPKRLHVNDRAQFYALPVNTFSRFFFMLESFLSFLFSFLFHLVSNILPKISLLISPMLVLYLLVIMLMSAHYHVQARKKN